MISRDNPCTGFISPTCLNAEVAPAFLEIIFQVVVGSIFTMCFIDNMALPFLATSFDVVM